MAGVVIGAIVGSAVSDFVGEVVADAVLSTVIDSGITSWHDDLTFSDGRRGPYGNQRVAKFVDFVNGQALPYDDNGHGSHVAGIVLGNGYDSKGRQSGMAPDASLVSLKVLDAQGKGTISGIIAALDWVSRNAQTYNIRVVNLSAGAAVTQSYWLDPLALAALVGNGSAVLRQAAQRELLTRGPRPGVAEVLRRIAESDTNVGARVAAIFTLKQGHHAISKSINTGFMSCI